MCVWGENPWMLISDPPSLPLSILTPPSLPASMSRASNTGSPTWAPVSRGENDGSTVLHVCWGGCKHEVDPTLLDTKRKTELLNKKAINPSFMLSSHHMLNPHKPCLNMQTMPPFFVCSQTPCRKAADLRSKEKQFVLTRELSVLRFFSAWGHSQGSNCPFQCAQGHKCPLQCPWG